MSNSAKGREESWREVEGPRWVTRGCCARISFIGYRTENPPPRIVFVRHLPASDVDRLSYRPQRVQRVHQARRELMQWHQR